MTSILRQFNLGVETSILRNVTKEMRCQMSWWISQSCEFLINLISWRCIPLSVCEPDWGCSHANTTPVSAQFLPLASPLWMDLSELPNSSDLLESAKQCHQPSDSESKGLQQNNHDSWLATNEQLNFISCSYVFSCIFHTKPFLKSRI